MNLIECLEQGRRHTYNEGLIVDFILSHTERVLHISIYELTKAISSPTSMIVRLYRKTGAGDFEEFKIRLFHDLKVHYQAIRNVDASMPFLTQDSGPLIAKRIAQLTAETTQPTRQLLAETMPNKSIDLFLTAKNILAVGVSNSYIHLADFQAKLLCIQLFVHLIPYQAKQFYLTINTIRNDVTILISYGGNAAEIINEARIFAEGSILIAIITSNLNSQLVGYATVILPIPNIRHADFKVPTSSSRLAIEHILNALYSCIFSHDFDKDCISQEDTPTSILKF